MLLFVVFLSNVYCYPFIYTFITRFKVEASCLYLEPCFFSFIFIIFCVLSQNCAKQKSNQIQLH